MDLPLEAAPACPVCLGSGGEAFHHLYRVPLHDGLLYGTREEAVECELGDIELIFCPDCGHIWNRLFEPDRLEFHPGYDISLHHSPVYAEFVDALARRLIREHELAGRTVLEIGCGKGEFLQALLAAGVGRGLGFDPTYVPSASDHPGLDLTIERRRFDRPMPELNPDAVVLRSVLQYSVEPRSLLDDVRTTLAARPAAIVYCEVPNGLHTFSQGFVWNVVYEHGNFYTPPSLATLFSQRGFDVHHVGPCFVAGQNLGLEARPSRTPVGTAPDIRAGIKELAQDVAEYSRLLASQRDRWEDELDVLASSGQRLLMWGAGARAISFLTSLRVTDQISAVIDTNPRRQGKFLPLTGQPVVAPEVVAAAPPDVILISNSSFATEIRVQAEGLGYRGRFLVL